MKYYYSPESQGFYIDTVNSSIPKDAFEVDENYYNLLFIGQENGYKISFSENKLCLVSQNREITIDMIRSKRNNLLNETDKYFSVSDYPIDKKMLSKLKTYRQELRDMTSNIDDLYEVVWPLNPLES